MVYLHPLFGPIASCGDEIARRYIPMSSTLRREYLAALGLEIWVVRGKSAVSHDVAPSDASAPRDLPMPREGPVPHRALAPRDAGAPLDSSPAREAGFDWPELRSRVA